MSDLNVRIVKLDAYRVAATLGFGAGPEGLAWEKMEAYLKQTQLLQDGQSHRFFGFNNPNPSPASPNYGYEVWVTVGEDAQPSADVKIKNFEGGLYAVTYCKGVQNLFEKWQGLVRWTHGSAYTMAHALCLEEQLSPVGTPVEEIEFDLYLALDA